MGRIELHGVRKRFGAVEAIRDVNLDVAEGSFTIFVGPSGCGKSTLLRLIAGLEQATAGEIRLDGREVTDTPPARRGLAMVFQSYALYPHMTVAENIAFGLRAKGVAKAERRAAAERAAQALRLTEHLDRKPRQLSGGQRQRVAIGRCIVRQPKAFLFDEPLSNLDAALRVEMRAELAELHRRLDATMIYVTHDQVEAMTLADQIVVLSAGQVMQAGAPRALYDRPANRFVAQFIGSPKMNVLPAGAVAGAGAGVAEIGVRPEHVALVAAGAGQVDGTVTRVEFQGADAFVHVDCGEAGPVLVREPGDTAARRGERVGLAFEPRRVHRFDAAGRALGAAA